MSTESDEARASADAAARRGRPDAAGNTWANNEFETRIALHDAERTVMRRLLCAARGIDEAHYWRMVEQEIRK